MFVARPVAAGAALMDLAGHWAAPAVEALVARGVLTGYPGGQFRPEQAVTRAEWVKMLVIAVAQPLPPSVLQGTRPRFDDVPAGHWARPFIEAAWEFGWIEGAAGERFGPDRPITRAEVAASLVRAVRLPEGSGGGVAGFVDADQIPAWAKPAVEAAQAATLLTGYPDGTFRPLASLARAEAATLLARLLRMQGAFYDVTGIVAEPVAGRSPAYMRVRLDSGREVRLPLAPSALLWRNGRPTPIDRLGVFDEVGVIFRDGQVVWIEAWYADDLGTVVAPLLAERRLTYRTSAGRVQAVSLTPDAVVYLNGQPVPLNALQPGDRVYVVLARDGRARALDAVRIGVRGMIWGRYVGSDGQVRIRVGARYTDSTWYPLAANALIFIDGERASWQALRIGDEAIAGLTPGGALQYIEVQR
ncbi:MAG TPA: S-layer homology domain-containing protein, partial [Bacillota bacterium]